MRFQTTSEISTSGSKTLRHTLTGHQSSAGHKSSENTPIQQDHKVNITNPGFFTLNILRIPIAQNSSKYLSSLMECLHGPALPRQYKKVL